MPCGYVKSEAHATMNNLEIIFHEKIILEKKLKYGYKE